MTRRIQRTGNFHLTLEIKNEDFLQTPREAQRNWVLNRSMREFSEELEHQNQLATDYVPGSDGLSLQDRANCALADEEIMEDWQIPVMQAMASAVASKAGDVLEIGFGRGIASQMIQELGVRSHTISECNPSVIERFHAWKNQHSRAEIHLLEGKWQDRVESMNMYDGIFFHTYPLNEQDFVEQVVQSVTFAEHFFLTAANHLRPEGIFTYLTNESDSLSRAHQRLLFEHFGSFHLSKVADLQIPADTKDAMWSDSMVVVQAIKS